MIQKPSAIYSHAKLGLKCLVDGDKTIAKLFYPGGPADVGGMMIDDVIVAVNGIAIEGNLDQWLDYFDEDEKRMTVMRAGNLIELVLPEVNRNFYMEYQLKPVKDPNNFQKKGFAAWSE